jgi:hypothetical protein
LWGLENDHDVKPDLSNLIKFYEDCANGILFHDDKQIVELKSKKKYSLNPRTVITVMPKKTIDIHETADQILQSLSPCDFVDLMEITYAIAKFANAVDKDTDVTMLESDPKNYRKQLTQAAMLVSELAERYSGYLTMIKKKYPKFHETCDQVEEFDEQFQCKADLHVQQFCTGKTLS